MRSLRASEKAYRREEGEELTVGWYIEATIRQQLDLSRYPLDHGDVSIRLWHRDFERNVALVPDLASYAATNPTALPGLAEGVSLSGWVMTASFFDYRRRSYNTDLGIPGAVGEGSFPELHFNITIKRSLINVVLTNGIPLLVVLLLLFAVLLSSTRDADQSKLLGFNPSSVVRLGSGLFFVVVLAHIQLRNTIPLQQIMLLEYSYFIVYLTILAVVVHSFVFFRRRPKLRVVEYEDSLIVKLLYWPVILGIQFAATAAVLY